jgi:hypothetical protein
VGEGGAWDRWPEVPVGGSVGSGAGQIKGRQPRETDPRWVVPQRAKPVRRPRHGRKRVGVDVELAPPLPRSSRTARGSRFPEVRRWKLSPIALMRSPAPSWPARPTICCSKSPRRSRMHHGGTETRGGSPKCLRRSRTSAEGMASGAFALFGLIQELERFPRSYRFSVGHGLWTSGLTCSCSWWTRATTRTSATRGMRRGSARTPSGTIRPTPPCSPLTASPGASDTSPRSTGAV